MKTESFNEILLVAVLNVAHQWLSSWFYAIKIWSMKFAAGMIYIGTKKSKKVLSSTFKDILWNRLLKKKIMCEKLQNHRKLSEEELNISTEYLVSMHYPITILRDNRKNKMGAVLNAKSSLIESHHQTGKWRRVVSVQYLEKSWETVSKRNFSWKSTLKTGVQTENTRLWGECGL